MTIRTAIAGVGLAARLPLASAAWLAAGGATAFAEARFGRNVFIGGHDFSNRRFDRRHRAVIHLYTRRPAKPGCATRPDGRGGWVKTCHQRASRRR